jgi:hypothetical protein
MNIISIKPKSDDSSYNKDSNFSFINDFALILQVLKFPLLFFK